VTSLGALGSRLEARLKSRSATVGVVGLGYVGLPLAVAFGRAGFPVIGVDTDPVRAALLACGLSPVEDVSARLGMSVWEVIGAAATKPFGFPPARWGPSVTSSRSEAP
jgi:UDP-N-acetyl-D-mannosaminuronate dehydrogenase